MRDTRGLPLRRQAFLSTTHYIDSGNLLSKLDAFLTSTCIHATLAPAENTPRIRAPSTQVENNDEPSHRKLVARRFCFITPPTPPLPHPNPHFDTTSGAIKVTPAIYFLLANGWFTIFTKAPATKKHMPTRSNCFDENWVSRMRHFFIAPMARST